jgi:hypothetical protein
MKAQVRLRSARWILFAAFAVAPVTGLAEQGSVAQEQSAQDPGKQAETAPAKTETAETKPEETPKQTETAPAKTEETKELTAEEAQAKKEKDAKVISGMSILGNQEAPKSLVIVPWKSSELGNSMDISAMLDDSRQPVDKEVFMRALSYYEIRSETSGAGGAPTTTNATQAATAANRRKP